MKNILGNPMNRRTLLLIVAASLCASVSQAQLLDAEYSFFEPITGFDDVISDSGDGYYFHYDRVYWTAHTERPTVGSRTAIVRHLEIWGPGSPASNRVPQDRNADTLEDSPIPLTVNPITRPILSNGLQQLFPRAAFDMGNRFGDRPSQGWRRMVNDTHPPL